MATRLGEAFVSIGTKDTDLKTGLSKAQSDVNAAVTGMTSAFGKLSGVFAGLGFGTLVRDIAETGMGMERLSQAFTTITGSAGGAMAELDFVRNISRTMGQDFVQLADGFKGISAAAMGTSLEGEKVRRVFESVVKYGTSLQLSNDQVRGSLLALSQMISKGTASMEEIRQQLGERMPGALQIMARAMNMTTAEFVDMVSKGEVVSSELLPKFAEELDKVSGKAESAAAAYNRLKNEWNDFKAMLWEGGIGKILAQDAEDITSVLKLLNEAPQRLKIFRETFMQTLNLVSATREANRFLRPETAESYAGIGGGVDEPRKVSQGSQELADKYWSAWKKAQEGNIKELEKLVDAQQKKELAGLEGMLNQAKLLRQSYAKQVADAQKQIIQSQTLGANMVQQIKREGMTPEKAQRDLESEMRGKLADSYSAQRRGDLQTARDLAEQARDMARSLDDQKKAIRGVESATRSLDEIYKLQQKDALAGVQAQEAEMASLKEQIDTKASKPMQELLGHISSVNIALTQAGETKFEIKGVSQSIAELDALSTKLDEINLKLQQQQQLKIDVKGSGSPTMPFSEYIDYMKDKLGEIPSDTKHIMRFRGQASPEADLSTVIARIMEQLNKLPTGTEHTVFFSTPRFINYGGWGEIDQYNRYLSEMQRQVNSMRTQAGMNQVAQVFTQAGISSVDAYSLATQWLDKALEREYMNANKSAVITGTYGFQRQQAFRMTGYGQEAMLSGSNMDMVSAIASALSGASGGSSYGGGGYSSGSGVNINVNSINIDAQVGAARDLATDVAGKIIPAITAAVKSNQASELVNAVASKIGSS